MAAKLGFGASERTVSPGGDVCPRCGRGRPSLFDLVVFLILVIVSLIATLLLLIFAMP